ncbi:MAG: hypothetical protein GY767_02520 [Shimia sp.]|nr:hypothetical protein [Shimia sp.]
MVRLIDVLGVGLVLAAVALMPVVPAGLLLGGAGVLVLNWVWQDRS